MVIYRLLKQFSWFIMMSFYLFFLVRTSHQPDLSQVGSMSFAKMGITHNFHRHKASQVTGLHLLLGSIRPHWLINASMWSIQNALNLVDWSHIGLSQFFMGLWTKFFWVICYRYDGLWWEYGNDFPSVPTSLLKKCVWTLRAMNHGNQPVWIIMNNDPYSRMIIYI